jgi:hypothetical protein
MKSGNAPDATTTGMIGNTNRSAAARMAAFIVASVSSSLHPSRNARRYGFA